MPVVEASVATVNVAYELTSGRIRHGAEMSRNLRVLKASKQEGVSVTLCGWDFRSQSVNGAVRSLT
jgi:GTP cyclohydrolase FolE2